jgi:hypothetical protein
VVDGVLTLGILWLDHCRQKGDGRRHFGGLKVIVPAGAWRTTAERMAWLNHKAADFQLSRWTSAAKSLTAVDFRDTGNLDSRLVHAFSAAGGQGAVQAGHRPADGAGSGNGAGAGGGAGEFGHRGGTAAAWAGVCAGAAWVRRIALRSEDEISLARAPTRRR